MPADTQRQNGSVRALLVPAITTLVVVGVLLSLGFWQLQRMDEKHRLIAVLNERLAAPPIPLAPSGQWPATSARDEFRRVTFAARIDASNTAQVYSSGSGLRKDIARNGVWVFAPAMLTDGASVVVNLGFVPEGQTVQVEASAEPVMLTGYMRFPEQANWLTPPADLAKRMWFLRDHQGMAQALHWPGAGAAAPFYIDLEAPVPVSGLPKPGPLTVNLKDNHLQYAVTWFLLALAVSIAFLVWLRQQKRARG